MLDDMDADGLVDIATPYDKNVYILSGTGNGGMTHSKTFKLPDSFDSLRGADFIEGSRPLRYSSPMRSDAARLEVARRSAPTRAASFLAVGMLACSCGGPEPVPAVFYPKSDAGASDVHKVPDANQPESGPCVAQTCAQLAAQCGTAPDGCGGVVACGKCEPGSICGGAGANKCGTAACTKTTCAQQGAACGKISNGCDDVIECGTCPAPQLCGASNQCCSSDCSTRTCGTANGCGVLCEKGSGCCEPICAVKLCGQSDGCAGVCQEGSGCCASQCAGKPCGQADGCGGTCTAGSGCCSPKCAGKPCGAGDGCSGTCAAGSGCCSPDCAGKRCGDPDGCSGTCDVGSGCETVWIGHVNYGDPGFQGACTGQGAKDTLPCRSAARRYCQSEDWALGFPIGGDSSGLTIVCVALGGTPTFEFAKLTAAHADCQPEPGKVGSVYTLACQAACDNYCRSHGFEHGFGPVELDSTNVTCSCLPDDIVDRHDVPFAQLPNCDVGDSGLACFSDAHAWCLGAQNAAGFGPVQANATAFGVPCIRK